MNTIEIKNWKECKEFAGIVEYNTCSDGSLYKSIFGNLNILLNKSSANGTTIASLLYCGKTLLDRYPDIDVLKLMIFLELKKDLNEQQFK